MEDGVGSDPDLVKKKNSSGFLVIKNKKEESSSSMKISKNDKKKKRQRLTDSEFSEDSLEQLDNKVVVESTSLRNGGDENERKRRLDVFEFDEYDNIDEKRMKEKVLEPGASRRNSIDKRKQFDRSRLRFEEDGNIDEKRTKKRFDKMNSSSPGKKDLDDYNVKSRLMINDDDDDDGDLPISSLKQKLHSPPNETIRSQGKNGVLKVMVSKNKKTEVPRITNYHKLDVEDEKVSKSEEITKKNKSVSFFSESKVKVGKPTTIEVSSTSRMVKRENVKSPGKIMSARRRVCKINRGIGTEKQKLREKLKNFLLDAGWEIDYRPRRSRNYLDAVYISPTGTTYWSIVKAYDALQKHMDDDVEMEHRSLSEDIKILTRKTQKKIEREMNMKRKEISRKRRLMEVSDEDSVSDTVEDEDEDDESSSPSKKNSELIKRNNSLKKKAGKLLKETGNSKGHKFGRCTLLVRSSEKGLNSDNEGYIPYTGKRTLISWLIDSGIVSLSEKVKYMNKKQTRVMLEGWATRDGIHCSCCSKVVPVSKFEVHAGSKLRQPYQNIYLESGVSLLQCQIEAWNKQEGYDHSGFHNVDIDDDDPNDDTCSLCGDGGDLICCDSCPSTFHQSCLDIEMLPPGDWHCPNCTCQFCGIGGTSSSADEDDTAVNLVLTCGLCEKKYHESCCQKVDDSSKSGSSSSSFCELKCSEIFYHLQKILGIKHELEAGFSWSLLRRTDVDTDASSFPHRVESNSKVAIALSIMNECFLPIVDRRSGINLVNSIVYNCGSNVSRLNYSGFYAVILERGDEIVAAASIRIRGTQLAEMPFIGTRHMYRRQGMCRRLLGAIEMLLLSLEVKKLTIPAIAEHMHTWTASFGFKPFDVSDKRELKSMNMVVFPGIDMLQKFLVKQNTSETAVASNSGEESIPPEDNQHLTPGMEKKTDVDACADHDTNKGVDGATSHNGDETNDKSDDVGSSMQGSVVPINGDDTKEMINEGDDPVFPLSPPSFDQLGLGPTPICPEGLDVGPKTDLNQLDTVSSSSPSRTDQPDARPKTDSDQMDLDQMDKTESKGVEAVKVCDSLSIPDSEADPDDNSDETISEIASNKPVVIPVYVPDPENTDEAEDNINYVDLPIQNVTFEDKECVPNVESESHVGSVVSSEVVEQPVKLNSLPSADDDVGDGHINNGEVASIEPILDSFTETPSQNEGINGEVAPLSVSETLKDETISKLRYDTENDMAKEGHEVDAS